MNVAYLFTFFLVVLIVLFLLLPFYRRGKSTFVDETPKPATNEPHSEEIALDLGRVEPGIYQETAAPIAAVDFDREIEVAVAVQRARRRKSTFSNCDQCGQQMKSTDRFCASCGHAR